MTLRNDLPGVLTDLEDVEDQVRAGAECIRDSPVLARYPDAQTAFVAAAEARAFAVARWRDRLLAAPTEEAIRLARLWLMTWRMQEQQARMAGYDSVPDLPVPEG